MADSEQDDGSSTDGDLSMDGGLPIDGASSQDGAPADSQPSTDGGRPTTLPIDLGTAVHFVILARGAVTNTPPSVIRGDIGDSASTTAEMTGFAWTEDASNTFATSVQVTGRAYAANHLAPTPADLSTAVGHMLAAFAEATDRTPDVTVVGAGSIGGMTLGPGVYRWTAALSVATSVTLTGNATDVWVFQIGAALDMAAAARVELAGGALPKNVFWHVGAAAALGAGAHCEGVIMAEAAVTLGAGASITGRLLSRTTVALDTSAVLEPAP